MIRRALLTALSFGRFIAHESRPKTPPARKKDWSEELVEAIKALPTARPGDYDYREWCA